jgi:hypothetical protein
MPKVKNKKLQSAIEYLLTYGWAILILVVIVYLMYYLVILPATITSSHCSMTFGVYCQDIIMGSNAVYSNMVILFTNTQQYALQAPNLSITSPTFGKANSTCEPNFVLPGGSIICIMRIPESIRPASLVSGRLSLNASICTNQNPTPNSCLPSPPQTYTGYFNAHVLTSIVTPRIEITFSAENSTQIANGVPDKLTANVKLFNSPISGATIVFSANQSYPIISPRISTTDSNGDAMSYISSTTAGNVLVNASFANESAFTAIEFIPYITVFYGKLSCFTTPDKSIYCVTQSGIYVFSLSTDKWTLMNNPPPGQQPFSCFSQTDGTLYCVTSSGIYLYSDGSWTYLGPPPNGSIYLSCTSSPDNNIYCVTSTGTYQYSSGSWSTIGNEPPGGIPFSCFVQTDKGTYCVTTTGTYLLSSNTWITQGPAPPGELQFSCFSTPNKDIYCVTYTGTYQFIGSSWSGVGPAPPGESSLSCYSTTDGSIYCSTATGVYQYVSNSWVQIGPATSGT